VTIADVGHPVWALWFYCSHTLIWLSTISILSVPDEGYSSNVPDEDYSSNVPDEGSSRNASCVVN